MSKGYPTREVDMAPPPELGLAADLCIICKKRVAGKGGMCATCGKALAGSA